MSKQKPRKAIAYFDMNKIKGTVKFIENLKDNNIIIDINISGLPKNSLHGFHVHKNGDMSKSCESMCEHFNPFHKSHGCPSMIERHVGDLGNLESDSKGCAKYKFYDNVIKLRGYKCNIIGRGLIIHQNKDDCGLGDNKESLKTGNAGKRIACAIIGILE